MSKPVCQCAVCYREWAEEQISRLEATIEQLSNQYSSDSWRTYAAFLRSVIRSGEKIPDDFDFAAWRQKYEVR